MLKGTRRDYERMCNARKQHRRARLAGETTEPLRRWIRLAGAYKNAPGKLGHIATGAHPGGA